ncbi:S1 family peptidase [bacterium]|nr:S1 family peptidase [bacterium]
MLRTTAALALLCVTVLAEARTVVPTLINGTEVPAGTWQEVIRITYKNAGCTATIVGKRAIVTAGHCVDTGGMANFSYKGKSYQAKMRVSSLYPTRDHDVAVGVTAQDITDAKPFTVVNVVDTAKVGTPVTLLGYGCTKTDGTGGNDGILRIGQTQVVGFSGFDMVLRNAGGAALCFGDSGGPAFTKVNNKDTLLGINSKGNIMDTSYDSRLDRQESIDLLKSFAQDNSIVICGINSTASTPECSDGPITPAPTCNLAASPTTVNKGGSVLLTLTSQNATSADIDGTSVSVPSGQKTVNPMASFTAVATVRNQSGQTGTCSAPVTVTDDPQPTRPTCTLAAIPTEARPGDIVTLELTASGSAETASINGTAVSVPSGRITVSHTVKAQYSAVGFVRNSAGMSSNCFVDYVIRDGQEPAQLPELALAATHCGDNRYPQTGIQSACISVVKRDPSWTEFFVSTMVYLKYADGRQEALPMLAFKQSASGANTLEEWTNAVGTITTGGTYPVVDTKYGKVTKASGGVPISMEGRNADGKLYVVQKLDPFNVARHLTSIQAPPPGRRRL